jgi:O-antigen/teichoic acid export membrane protein
MTETWGGGAYLLYLVATIQPGGNRVRRSLRFGTCVAQVGRQDLLESSCGEQIYEPVSVVPRPQRILRPIAQNQVSNLHPALEPPPPVLSHKRPAPIDHIRQLKERSLDSGTKRRLLLGFLSNWISKMANTVIQLVQVPLFFHFWDTRVYGEWLIVSAIPSYLAFSNIGFGSVAGNEMTMMESAGDREGTLRVFQSCWWLIVSICGCVAVLLGPVLYFVPVARVLHVRSISPVDTKWIIFYLGLSILLGQLEQLLQCAYTCIGRYPYGSFIKSMISLAASAAMMVPICLGHGPRTAALVFAIGNALGTLLICVLVQRDIPWIEFGWRRARLSEIRRLTGPAIAFMGFPIGNALNLQGTLMAVGYALGPVNVAIFSSARTVSRVALQMVQMVNVTFWPELSLAYGAKNEALIRTLHRRACQAAIIIAVVIVICMMSFGPWFLSHWTGGHVPPSRPLLAILLLVVIFYALWSTSSTLVAAINQHQRLAAWYIAGTSITIAFTIVLAKRYGLYGAAASLLISEFIMNIYVLPNSLRIAKDTFPAFLASMVEFPASLHPQVLLRRLSRSKPSLES